MCSYFIPLDIECLTVHKILGSARKQISVPIALYMGPGKMFHWDILAQSREDVAVVLQENWDKLERVMRLFGEELTGWHFIKA